MTIMIVAVIGVVFTLMAGSVVGRFTLYVIYWWRNLRELNQVLSSLIAAKDAQGELPTCVEQE